MYQQINVLKHLFVAASREEGYSVSSNLYRNMCVNEEGTICFDIIKKLTYKS
jgi:hypothetical protein